MLFSTCPKVTDTLRVPGRKTTKDVDEALREVKLALLEADVNFKVVPSSSTG